MDSKNTFDREHQIWNEYRARLFRFVQSRVNDTSVAEDIVHDVLTKVYAHLDRLKDHGKFKGWIYQITRNAIVDYYRNRKHLEKLPDTLIDSEVDVDKIAVVSESAEKEISHCITPLIEQLPTHYRQAVILSEFEGITQKTIASRLGLSTSGAKSRVQRGRKMLETMLLECCRFEFDRGGSIVDFEPKEKCSQTECREPSV